MRYWLLKQLAIWCGLRVHQEVFYGAQPCLLVLASKHIAVVTELQQNAPLVAAETAADLRVH